jgi:alpha-tubulin suppressor-like RCC1 family protein
MRRLVIVLTVWVMGLAWVATAVVLPAGSASADGGIIKAATVSNGGNHSCALTTVGGVKCWGNNMLGQLGNGSDYLAFPFPVDVVGLGSGAVAVSAGGDSSCAVTSAGAVKCWGENSAGQLGDGTTTDSRVPVDVVGLGSGAVAVSASWGHSCAVTSAGAVKCWGFNGYGQLGNGTTTNSRVPVSVVGLGSGVVAVSASYSYSCAVATAGAVKCWGDNADGQLGNGTRTRSPLPVDVVGLSSGVVAVSAGWSHACALATAGAVKCWGSNDSGKLGNGTTTGSTVPVGVVGLGSGVVAVSAGLTHSCAVATAGAAKCWGGNGYGQLGNGTTADSRIPVGVVGLGSGAAGVAAGGNPGEFSLSGDHSCAVTTAGTVRCWGNSNMGQLGNGTYTRSSVPVDVIGLGTAAVTRLGDFNRDGVTDLVARDTTGRLWLYPGNGTGGFLSRRQMGQGWNSMTTIVTPGDVTGDGNADILGRDTGGRLWLYPGNGAGSFLAKRQIGKGWNIMNAITNAANLNGAGRSDLLTRDTAGNLWLYPLSGNAVFGRRSKISTDWAGYTTILGPGDVSGDGSADILARDAGGSLWLYLGDGTGAVGGPTLVSPGLAAMTALITPGNWDRAAGNDLLTRDAAGLLWLNQGDNAGGFDPPRQIGKGWQGMTYIG